MNAPMFKNKYMAHALGGYQDHKYLNNEQALLNSIKNGHKYFEVDLTLTEDGHMVPSHGWTEANCLRCGMEYSPEFEHMTKEMFLEQKVGGMPTMDTETLYGYMKKYEDFFWQLDLHTLTKEKAAEVTKAVVKDFHEDDELLGKVLVQANSTEMFEGVDSVYHFNYYQMFIPKGTSPEGLEKLLRYCNDHGFVSVALSAADADEEHISMIKDHGLRILVYSVDNQKRADRLIDMGADTICTNTLSPRGDRIALRKSRSPKKMAGRVLRKIKTKVQLLSAPKAADAAEAFRRKDHVQEYTFCPEDRQKYRLRYLDILSRNHVKPGPRTVNDFYFEKPIEKKTILISGLGRSVRGSMQYLLDELNSNDDYEGFRIYVRTSATTHETVKEFISRKGWKRTEALSKGFTEKLETAEFLVTESYFPYEWTRKPGQMMIDLWHGTPLKCLGVIKNGNRVHNASIHHKNFLSADYLMYPNYFTRDVMWDSYRITSLLSAKALMMGYPRTSGLMMTGEEEAAALKKQLAPGGEHIYAYMPTFRGYLSDAETVKKEAEFLDYLDSKLRDDQILYVNLHHQIHDAVDCSKYSHIRAFPPVVDSYSLLSVTDALITDYSSVFFDYLALRRQIILYIEDLDTYRSFQGLNMDIESLPFDLARSREQVIDMLNRGKQYDDTEIWSEICAHDSADNPAKFCRLFLRDEEGLTVEPIPGNDKCKTVLYAEGCAAGHETDRLFEISKINKDSERIELWVGCDEDLVSKNMESAYPALHEVTVLDSQAENRLSSIGSQVLGLYKSGKLDFDEAMGFLHYEYGLYTKRMYGDTHFGIMGIYDTTDPEMVLGLALSDASVRLLFISDRMSPALAEDLFLKDAVRCAAAYCKYIVADDEDKAAQLRKLLEETDRDKIVIAKTAGEVTELLEGIAEDIR